MLLLYFLYLGYLALKLGAGLEGGDIVLGHYDGLLLGDVAGGLGSTLLQVEGAEATQENILTIGHSLLDDVHESLDGYQSGRLINAGLV